jgi:hypothetical protein
MDLLAAACKSNRRREVGSYIVNSGKSQLLIVAMGYCPFIGQDLLRLMRRVENPSAQTLDDLSDGNEFSGARGVHHRERTVGSGPSGDAEGVAGLAEYALPRQDERVRRRTPCSAPRHRWQSQRVPNATGLEPPVRIELTTARLQGS